MLEQEHNRQVLDQVKDSSSSLICLRDSASIRTSWTSSTEGSSMLDKVFDFDAEILKSNVYQGQVRSLIRRALRRGKNPSEQHKSLDGSSRSTSLKSTKVPKRSLQTESDTARSMKIDYNLSRDKLARYMNVEVLLLGPSISDTSIILDLISLASGNRYTSDERQSFKRKIFDVMIQGMRKTLNDMDPPSLSLQDSEMQRHIQLILAQSVRTEPDTLPDTLSAELSHAIRTLWQDNDVKSCFIAYGESLEREYAKSYVSIFNLQCISN